MLAFLTWRACARSSVHWDGLIVDDATARASHTKLWSHVGNAAMTVLVIRIGWNATAGEGIATLLLFYGGLVAGSQIASKLLGARAGISGTPGTVTTETKLEEKKTTVAASAPATVPAASTESAVPLTERKSS